MFVNIFQNRNETRSSIFNKNVSTPLQLCSSKAIKTFGKLHLSADLKVKPISITNFINIWGFLPVNTENLQHISIVDHVLKSLSDPRALFQCFSRGLFYPFFQLTGKMAPPYRAAPLKIFYMNY